MFREIKNKREFSGLIEKNQPLIHKVTRIYGDNPTDREDLFQEICLQLWKAYPGFKGKSKFSTWMYRVALNTAINFIRKRKPLIKYESLNEHTQVPSETEAQDEQVLLIYEAIGTLNRIDKAIILLWLEDKNYDEIAAIMGISKVNVSVKLVRIKRKLEEWIHQKRGKSDGR